MDVTQLIPWLEKLGAAGAVIFAVLYWRADMERKEMQRQLLATIPQVTVAIESAKNAIEKLALTVAGQNGGRPRD